MSYDADKIKQVCDTKFAANADNCSGFAEAVASALDVPLRGDANQIVVTLRGGGGWTVLQDGVAAQQQAALGGFVLAGLRGDEQAVPDTHGHVVVVVAGLPLAHGAYPFAYWGSLGGTPGRDKTLNWAWNVQDRDKITYAFYQGTG